MFQLILRDMMRTNLRPIIDTGTPPHALTPIVPKCVDKNLPIWANSPLRGWDATITKLAHLILAFTVPEIPNTIIAQTEEPILKPWVKANTINNK
jgi:hypothetical protein